MPKFILIDQSIKDLGGHHYEYAVRVLKAAERLGYEPVLATNRSCEGVDSARWTTVPTYRLGFWEMPLRMDGRFGWLERFRRAKGRFLLRTKYSRVGLVWAYRKRGIHLERAIFGLPKAWLIALSPVIVLVAGLKTAGVIWSSLGPLQPALRFAWRVALALLKLIFLLLVLPLWPAAWAWRKRYKLVAVLREQLKAKYFGQDTRALFKKISLDDHDVVFIPTIADTEMVGLGPYLMTSTRSQRAAWHLLFRRNLYIGRDPEYAAQEAALRPVRNAFHNFLASLSGHKVYFWTDTDQLTDQWNRLGAAEFHTLPIPIDAEYAEPRHKAPADPLTVVYAGDARQEKGYQYLPRVVGDLWDDQRATGVEATRDTRFVFQSNFSGGTGDAPSRVARAQLVSLAEAGGPDRLKLLMEALDCDAYRELVVSGDVVLVLYDRNNYYARSSGIFAEAMIAGLPVVVPCGSWMSVHLNEPIAASHDELLESCRTQLVNPRWAIQHALTNNPYSAETGELNIAGSQPRFCWIDVPDDVTHLRFSARQSAGSSGRFVQLWVAQLDEDKQHLTEGGQILGGIGGGRLSALVPIANGARRIWFGLTGAYAQDPLILSDVQISFARSEAPLPIGAVGAVYNQPDGISDALRELVRFPEHYRRTAGEFADHWSAWHNPDTLVRLLREATEGRPLEPIVTDLKPRSIRPHRPAPEAPAKDLAGAASK